MAKFTKQEIYQDKKRKEKEKNIFQQQTKECTDVGHKYNSLANTLYLKAHIKTKTKTKNN